MKKEFKKFEGKSYYEINDDKIYCSYNVFLDRIRISTGFFKILNNNEAKFIFAHEQGHRNDRNFFLIILLFVYINIIFTFLSLLLTITNKIFFEWLKIFTIFTIVSLFLLIIFYRLMEYRADEYASRKVNFRYFVTAIKKMKNEKYNLLDKIVIKLLHPNVEKRIEHILRLKYK